MKPLLTILCVLGVVQSAWGVQHPDILMIAVDDLRPMLSCYGDPRIKTPHLDRLAQRSVLFERAYCQLAKCGPSRLSMMTGLRPGSTGVFGHSTNESKAFRKLRPDVVSLARWFTDHGYETRSLGKIDHDGWQLASDWSSPPLPGRERELLEIYDEANPDGPSIISDRYTCPVMQHPDVEDTRFFDGRVSRDAIEVYQQRPTDKPLFLAVGFRRPHLPFIAPKRYYDLHSPDESWLPRNPHPPVDSPPMAWLNSDGYRKAAIKQGVILSEHPTRQEWQSWNGYEMRSYNGVPVQGEINSQLQLELIRSYAACVSYVDAQIGKLLDAVDPDTIIVLWADHGWHLGEQSAWGKMTNFEIATRVPLLISVPGIPHARTDAISELVDIYPTLCDLAGIELPSHLEGESLLSVLHDPSAQRDQIAMSEYPRFENQYHGRAIRTERYRFVQWREGRHGPIVDRELYDHQSDPDETLNIANLPEHSALVNELEARLQTAFQLP